MLVETHSWKDYATRVRIHRNLLVAIAEIPPRATPTQPRIARDVGQIVR